MKLLKKINNNFALALDSKGEQIIVEGKGIGFQKMPCELTDYNMITRTYYDYDDKYRDILDELPQEVMDIANSIYEYITAKINCVVNPNLPFILADHIDYAVKRMRNNIDLKFPLYYDLVHLYPFENEAAEYGLKLIKTKLNVDMPEEEKAGIILNIVNAEANVKRAENNASLENWIRKFIEIINKEMNVKVDKESFSYSRFVYHINYLYKRIKEKEQETSTDNIKMYKALKEQCPKTYQCVKKIAKYLEKEEKIKLNEEEKMYLILHVNRLCNHEIGL